MIKRLYKVCLQIISTIFISAFLIVFPNKDFPNIGHDYYYFIPRLIDVVLHYKINGLSIQWYTPSFGGGLPGYSNPQNIQFSLPQLLSMVANPWVASIASSIIFAIVGYFSMQFFLKRILSLSWQASILGGLFFTINGFYIEHVTVGHLGYHAFPLLPIIYIALFADFLPPILGAIIIAIVFAVVIHQAGFYLIVIFVLSSLLLLPILYLLYPRLFIFKRLKRILIFASIFTGLMIGSKVFAVISLMHHIPRHVSDYYDVTPFFAFKGLITQYLGTMNLVPVFWLLGKDIHSITTYLSVWTGAPYGLWELDVSLSPVLVSFLLAGIIFQGFAMFRKRLIFTRTNLIVFLILLLGMWLNVEFIMARGYIYPALRNLPILNSLHVNVRFASAAIFPLALLGAFFYEKLSFRWISFREPVMYSILVFLTLGGALNYFVYTKDVQSRTFNITRSLETYQRVQAGDTFPVEKITDIADDGTFLNNASDIYPYEPLLGSHLENFWPEVVPGPVTDIFDGKYNMTNPTGYVFPEENQAAMFDRIPVEEADKFRQFIHRFQPDWKRPILQNILDITSLSSFIALTSVLLGYLIYRLKKKHGVGNRM